MPDSRLIWNHQAFGNERVFSRDKAPLEKLKKRLEILLEKSSSSIVLWGRGDQPVMYNVSWAKMVEKDFQGKLPTDFKPLLSLPAETRMQLEEIHRRAFAGEELRVEWNKHFADGSFRCIEMLICPILIEHEAEFIAVIGDDVTDRKILEMMAQAPGLIVDPTSIPESITVKHAKPAKDMPAGVLDENPQHLDLRRQTPRDPADLIYESFLMTEQPVLLCDWEGYPTIYNHAYERFVRRTIGIEMQPGLKPHLMHSEKERHFWEDVYERVLRGDGFSLVHSFDCVDGEVRVYDFFFSPVVLHGKVRGIFQIGREVTEPKNGEGKLAWIGKYLHTAVETDSDYAVFNLKADPSLQWRTEVCFVSPSIRKVLGIDDPLDFPQWMNKLHPADRDMLEKRIRAPGKNRSMRQIVRVEGPDGGWRSLQLDWTVTRQKNQDTLDVNGIMMDVTIYKELEERLIAGEEKLVEKETELQEVKRAVTEMIKHRENDRQQIEERLSFNLKENVGPMLDQLKRLGLTQRQQSLLAVIESSIEDACSSFTRNIALAEHGFTPTEIRVALLIRDGKSSKEIAGLLGVSSRTVDSHRKNIRRKLGLNRSSRNLRSCMLTLD